MELRTNERDVLQRQVNANLAQDASYRVLPASPRVERVHQPVAVIRGEKTVRKPECQNCDWRQATGYAQCGHPVVRCLLTGSGHRLHDVCTDWERQR